MNPPCECNCGSGAIIEHTEGYKDEFLVAVTPEKNTWTPTNEQLFTLIDKWFESEDAEFGDAHYGRMMPFFYVALIAIGEEEKAHAACNKEGYQAIQHFQQCVDDHRDEIIEALKNEL